MMKASLKKATEILLGFVLFIALLATVAVFGIRDRSDRPAFAMSYALSRERGVTVSVNQDITDLFTDIYVDDGGTNHNVFAFSVCIDDDSWQDTLFSNITTILHGDTITRIHNGMFTLVRDYTLQVTDDNGNKYLADDHTDYVAKSPSDANYTANIVSAKVNGTNFKGETVTNAGLNDLVAGVYTFTDIVISYNLPKLKAGGQEVSESEAITGEITVNKISIIGYEAKFVLYSQVEIDVPTNYRTNFALDDEVRTCDGTNKRNIVNLYSASASDNAFAITTDSNARVVALKKGLGSLQTTSNTTFESLKDYLQLDFYSGTYFDVGADSYYKYYFVDPLTQIKNAGKYKVKFSTSKTFSDKQSVNANVYNPIKVVFRGEAKDAEFDLEILKKDMKIILDYEVGADGKITDKSVGFKAVFSKEFDDKSDAWVFSNIDRKDYISQIEADLLARGINPDSADWAIAQEEEWTKIKKQIWLQIGGIENDFNLVKNHFSELFNFGGSTFSDKSVGKNKTVFMQVDFLAASVSDSALSFLCDNYTLTPYGYNAARQLQKLTMVSGKGYNAGNIYEITPNAATIRFSQYVDLVEGSEVNLDGKYYFQDLTTYGEEGRLYASDFEFYKYIVIDNATEKPDDNTPETQNRSTGKFSVKNQSKWIIQVANDQLDKLQGNEGNNTLYVLPVVGQEVRGNEPCIFTDKYGTRYTDYSGRLYAGNYTVIYKIKIVYDGGRTLVPGIIADGCYMVRNESNVDLFEVKFEPKAFTVLPKDIKLTVKSLTTEKDYDGTDVVLNSRIVSSGVDDDDRGFYDDDYGEIFDFNVWAYYASAGACKNSGDKIEIK